MTRRYHFSLTKVTKCFYFKYIPGSGKEYSRLSYMFLVSILIGIHFLESNLAIYIKNLTNVHIIWSTVRKLPPKKKFKMLAKARHKDVHYQYFIIRGKCNRSKYPALEWSNVLGSIQRIAYYLGKVFVNMERLKSSVMTEQWCLLLVGLHVEEKG